MTNMISPAHKRYKELSDFNKKNEFHVEDYLEHKLVLPLDQEFELYEYEVSPEEAEAAEKEGIQQCGLKQKTDQEGTEVFLSLISVLCTAIMPRISIIWKRLLPEL